MFCLLQQYEQYFYSKNNKYFHLNGLNYSASEQKMQG